MKNLPFLALAVPLLAFGCSEPPKESTASPAGNETANAPAPSEPTTAKAPNLGAIVGGAHFGVKVTSDPTEPKVGSVKFTIMADHHGQPASGLPVQVRITKIDGDQLPVADAQETGVGQFEATVEIPTAGDYHLEAILGAGSGHDEIAKYRFTAIE
ncbi:MAG: hypothetical protein AMXMBFR81_01240 [Chthonomonas sp.]